MKESTPSTIHLKDYTPVDYKFETVYLTFELHNTNTLVHSKIEVEPLKKGSDLVLDGEELKLEWIKVNGQEFTSFAKKDDTLVLSNLPTENFTLEILVEINPEANKALDGLYKSGGIFCTQNEAQGFRRITYFQDRPDSLSKFTTKMIADKKEYPVLLSNGNPIESGDLADGKHFAVWEDPFYKPCYLYALVAGDLALVQDSYTTGSGRKIDLRIYIDKGNEDKCDHAMESLKKSMKWDEDRFGLEYDLDIYMIVAVDSFNMGAMENKGLNIFNSAYVLANQQTATDKDFYGIESVIGHEYFHNWTGNRVTCRDWFQLTLKEGLTVYRDQEFSSDMNSRVVDRIQGVQALRSRQFSEDAGPNAHPIKPKSYIEINNFYTATIYEKGAEVIRMYETLLGRDGFRKGMDKYFELHDGQAVTTEDFLNAMSVANGNYDFSQFKLWYDQAGTPKVVAKYNYDSSKKEFSITFTQSIPDTPGQTNKLPMLIPMKLGLLNASGKDMALTLVDASSQPQIAEGIVLLTKKEETFTFKNIDVLPVVSLNRNFSAPINLESDNSKEDLAFLMAHDSDSFNRYEAAQEFATQMMLDLVAKAQKAEKLSVDPLFEKAYGKIIEDNSIDNMFKALALTLPGQGTLHQRQEVIDYKATHAVCEFVLNSLASTYEREFAKIYSDLATEKPFSVSAAAMGERSLKNLALSMLMQIGTEETVAMAEGQFYNATNMTDEAKALQLLVHNEAQGADKAVKSFYDKWSSQTLVYQKLLGILGGNPSDSVYDKVLEMEQDKHYDRTVPNIVRALYGSFAANYTQFNHESGRGYKLVANKILELDKQNPQIASRFATLFKDYKRLPSNLKELAKVELTRIVETEGLSKNVFEIVSKTLA
ncbi:membrane alanyl aminopeptidase [Bacteriovorax sp. BSW11_IV]|uniref:aminopeptidase N n=1 Tax=Bacteriovorax sp. BSW11_IV TaxID=1353529 RepID=UPI00038A482B|nr:aminopeptidase N [Bacteriovorax sp. BSW11_IV]EQC44068.1 membrane alanyl aminopeptidase [Bacteriovorax sp. BSW11_IV]